MKSILVLVLFLGFSPMSFAKIAFQKQVGAKRLIVVADNDGLNQKVISDKSLDTYHPEMGPEGRYVAYSRGTIKPGTEVNVELVIKDLEKNVTEIWTPKGDQYIHAEFSGNGRYLVLSGQNPANAKQNIMLIDLVKERENGPAGVVVDVNGKKTHSYLPKIEIIESPFDCYAPAVSSDASLIVYHRTLDKNDKTAPKQLIVYDRGAKTKTEITEQKKHAMFPSLSSDDRYVAYVSKDGGQWDIYLYDLWKKQKSKVTDDDNVEFTPVFASNNDLYYTRFATDSFNNALIDIYSIPKEQVFDPSAKAIPQAFLDDKKSAEYVVSFSNPQDLKMEQGTDLLLERSSFGSVFHDKKIFIAGGHQGPEHTYPKESFLDVLEVYDLKTKTWQSLSPMKLPKHGFQMIAHRNYLYVFGGFAFSETHNPQWKSVNTIERYDINNDRWEILPQKLPRNRSSNALAKVGNKVYLIGGWDSTPKFDGDKDGQFLRAVDVFDLNTQTSSVSPMTIPDPLRRALTAVVVKDEIFLLGGIGEGASHFEWIDNVTAMNPKKQTWRELAPLPFATFAPGAGEIDGDIYLFGGMVLKDLATFDLNYVDDIYRLDSKSKEWSHSGIYLNKNKGFPQVVPLPKNRLGILGGHTYEMTPNGIVDHPVKSFEILGK